MRAILIEPRTAKISEVSFKGTLEHAYQLLGIENESRLITGVPIDDAEYDSIYVDEEGLLRPKTIAKGGFKFPWTQILVGNGLILGEDDEGDWASTKISIEVLQRTVTFS